MTADDIIRRLGLRPLPWEGGYYRETWRSSVDVPADALPSAYGGVRSSGTVIYYLLTPETVSRMHRLPSAETFHFYFGDKVDMLLLYPGGDGEIVTFGHDIAEDEQVQFTIAGNTWMGGRLKPGGETGYALMGTTVSPGFDFDDLEMGDGRELAAAYPAFAERIRLLS